MMNPNNGPKLKLVKVKAISPGSGGRSKKDNKNNVPKRAARLTTIKIANH